LIRREKHAGGSPSTLYLAESLHSAITVLLAESVSQGGAVGLSEEGLGVVAGEVAAIGVAMNSGAEGDYVAIARGVVACERYNFDVGKTVWFRVGSPNLTTQCVPLEKKSIVQAVGAATNSNELIVMLDTAGSML